MTGQASRLIGIITTFLLLMSEKKLAWWKGFIMTPYMDLTAGHGKCLANQSIIRF